MPSSVALEVLTRLFGRLRVPIPSDGASPLFIFEDGDELTEGMPVFDELGLVRAGRDGLRASPSGAERAESGGAVAAAGSSTQRGD